MYEDLSEAQYAAVVDDIAATLGWRNFGVLQSTRYSEKAKRRVRNVTVQGVGFPDRVYVRARDGRMLFVEFKRNKGRCGGTEADHVEPTDEQKAWLGDLAAVAEIANAEDLIQTYVWRPADYDLIVRILT